MANLGPLSNYNKSDFLSEMPPEISFKIASYLTLEELPAYSLVAKQFTSIKNYLTKKILLECALTPEDTLKFSDESWSQRQVVEIKKLSIELHANKTVHTHIAKIIGIVKFNKIPTLNLQALSRYKNSDYIDFIRADQVSESVMKGVDERARPFVVFKTINRNVALKKQIGLFVLHHRYSKNGLKEMDDKDNWVVAYSYSNYPIGFISCSMEKNLARIEKLLLRKPVGELFFFITGIEEEKAELTKDGKSVIELV